MVVMLYLMLIAEVYGFEFTDTKDLGDEEPSGRPEGEPSDRPERDPLGRPNRSIKSEAPQGGRPRRNADPNEDWGLY